MTPLDAPPDEAAKLRFARRRIEAVFRAHGYREVGPSLLEPAGHAARLSAPALQLGELGELRTDAMAAIARVYVQGPARPFARLMMAGAVFDDQPADSTRAASFDAVAGVLFGVAGPAADAEVGALAAALAGDPGLTGAEVALGTLGEAADLSRFLAALEPLPPPCPRCAAAPDRLRFFSCAAPPCRARAERAPPVRQFVGTAALQHHEVLLATLEAAGVTVHDDPRLAFGAQRYRRTLVELRARDQEGALRVVARGGRRDGMVDALGGAAAPAVGLTVGLARAAACVAGAADGFEVPCEIFFAARGAAARAWAFAAAAVERARGFRVDVDLGDGGWADQLARAAEVRARVVVLCGELERSTGEVAVRDMQTRQTRRIPEDELPRELKRLLR